MDTVKEAGLLGAAKAFSVGIKGLGAKPLGSSSVKGLTRPLGGIKKSLVHQKMPVAKPNAFAKFNTSVPTAPHTPTAFIPRPTLKYK